MFETHLKNSSLSLLDHISWAAKTVELEQQQQLAAAAASSKKSFLIFRSTKSSPLGFSLPAPLFFLPSNSSSHSPSSHSLVSYIIR